MSDWLEKHKASIADQRAPEPSDPAVLPAILTTLREMRDELMQLRKLEESKVPVSTKSIIATIGTDVVEYRLMPPWISFGIANDGPDDVVCWVNDEAVPTRTGLISSGGTASIDLIYPIIEVIYLKSAGTSAIRMLGAEGRV